MTRARFIELCRRQLGRLPRPTLLLGAAAGLAGVVAAAACEMQTASLPPATQAPGEGLILQAASFDELPGWREDPLIDAAPALTLSCERLLRQGDERPVGDPAVGGLVGDWRPACGAVTQAAAQGGEALRRSLEEWFQPFRATNAGDPEGLFTGYYEAEIRAARRPDATYRYPIHAVPSDLVSVDPASQGADWPAGVKAGRQTSGGLAPYFTRAQIEKGALEGRGLELLWSDDPVDLYFLQVQGSGVVTLPSGETLRIGFAGSNGHPFTGAGKVMREEGLLDSGRMSAQNVRAWLKANPEEGRRIMHANARYIFFRKIEGPGPIGAQGVPLTPVRSLAVDPRYVPYGTPLWLDTTFPRSGQPLRRLMVAQDTGSAIRGPVRGDVYWGSGERALDFAGPMKQRGGYYLLLPKAVAQRRLAAGS